MRSPNNRRIVRGCVDNAGSSNCDFLFHARPAESARGIRRQQAFYPPQLRIHAFPHIPLRLSVRSAQRFNRSYSLPKRSNHRLIAAVCSVQIHSEHLKQSAQTGQPCCTRTHFQDEFYPGQQVLAQRFDYSYALRAIFEDRKPCQPQLTQPNFGSLCLKTGRTRSIGAARL
jgi:hypothetical protein